MKSPKEEIAQEISSRYLTVTHRTNAGNLHFDVVLWEPIVDDGFYKVRKNRERAQYTQPRSSMEIHKFTALNTYYYTE